ncbi:fructose-6-phosphate aldolase [bacterium]|jgi:transaldolase|nr:fructose-6-phosphate aldolase [bacterium]
MEFFVDSAEVELIKEVNEMGLVDGVTTNPTLIKKAGRDHEETIREISSFIDGPISVETLSEDAEGIIKEADVFSKWGKNIVIKVVMNAEGMKAVKELSKRGIKTNVTLIFSPLQAMIAAKAGATYVSPFVGRLDDIGHVGMEVISDIRDIFDNYSMSTKILVASIRSPQHISEAALIGADVSTVPPAILKQLLKHPLTDKGIAAFLEDAKAWKQNVTA